MAAVFAHYHEGNRASLDRELAYEPRTIRNTTTLEFDDWLQINGAFVSGRVRCALSILRPLGCPPAVCRWLAGPPLTQRPRD